MIACNSQKMVDMLDFAIVRYSITVMYSIYECILSFICKEENWDGDTGHFTAWGTLYFPMLF